MKEIWYNLFKLNSNKILQLFYKEQGIRNYMAQDHYVLLIVKIKPFYGKKRDRTKREKGKGFQHHTAVAPAFSKFRP